MKLIRVASFFISTILFVFGISYLLLMQPTEKDEKIVILSPIADAASYTEQNVLSAFTTGIEQAVDEALQGSLGSYSIVVKDLTTGETYSRNPGKQYGSASLYKLWTMAVVYQQVEQKKLNEDQIVSESVAALNKKFAIPDEAAERKTGTVSASITQAVEKMITISDNYSAHLLNSKVSVSSLSQFLKQENFLNSKTGSPPITTAEDISLYYEKLYRGEIVSEKSSEKMLAVLKRQQLNNRIPKYLPANTAVAHKTGELGGYKHDAGIVFTPQGDYILVVLSQSDNPFLAAERIALISRNIYQYFTKPKE